MTIPTKSAFGLDNRSAYQAWRDIKLARIPTDLGALLVEVQDIAKLTNAEKSALSSRIENCNMAIYTCNKISGDHKQAVRELGRQFRLNDLDHNQGADDEGITELEVKHDAAHQRYIPYSNRAIHWHTDGYYNTPDQTIRSLLLHCVQPAPKGGENALLDHELAYIHLRDLDPEYIRALMQPDAMTIPANVIDGKEIRPARSGPVFSIDPQGQLQMRYTARARHVEWKQDAAVSEAVTALVKLLGSDASYIYRGTLVSGQGLICNNVLHDRSSFDNTESQTRLLYRLRYYNRISL